ncbi:MAG TPA: hypothetical protein VI603_01180 [Saprospiraceae bacterium]|nr:hypothetical protein [Saprospiraceae bacterium]
MKFLVVLRGLLYAACLVIVACIVFIIISNKSIPRGVVGPEAEAITDSMLAAVNCDAWERLRYVAWSYQGKRHYVWDKLYNLVEIRYRDVRVLLNLNTIDGIVWKKGERRTIEKKRKCIAEAWKFWCNDSFWLNPICKLRDGGAVRRLVSMDDDQRALLVTYTRGGLTPGDSFLWITEKYVPTEWRMWVRLLPIRGLKATWEQWTIIEDVRISTRHHIGPYRIVIEDLRSGRHHSELGLERDPFIDFVTE